jgi:hypothetical protein
MCGFLRRVRSRDSCPPRAGHKSSLVCAAAIAGSGPVNATTDLQSIESVHGAANARDPRFAGKSGVDIWDKPEPRG